MKKFIFPRLPAIACGAALLIAATIANGQTSTIQSTTTTTNSQGTISSFTPNMITVRSESSSTPVSYSYTKETTYVDQNGNPVTTETIRSGTPVTVYYTQDGGQMVANRVVVHRTVTQTVPAPPPAQVFQERKTTTTTTTSP